MSVDYTSVAGIGITLNEDNCKKYNILELLRYIEGSEETEEGFDQYLYDNKKPKSKYTYFTEACNYFTGDIKGYYLLAKNPILHVEELLEELHEIFGIYLNLEDLEFISEVTVW